MILTALIFLGLFLLLVAIKSSLENLTKKRICPICLALFVTALVLIVLMRMKIAPINPAIPAALLGASLIFLIKSLEKYFKIKGWHFGFYNLSLTIVGFATIISYFDNRLILALIFVALFLLVILNIFLKKTANSSERNQKPPQSKLREKLEHCCD